MVNKIELGSEFNISLNDLQVVDDNLFTYLNEYDVQWYDYGRTAIKQIPVPAGKKILLPEFICESVIACFDKCLISFYRVDDEFYIDIDSLLDKIDDSVGCIYIAHYFGFLQRQSDLEIIKKAAAKHEIIIIEDTTQSLFSKHQLCGNYVVSSIRKWMAVPMGGVLYTTRGRLRASHYQTNIDNTKAYGMILKDMFLKSGYDTNLKYQEIFAQSEDKINYITNTHTISDFTKFLISCESIEKLISKRKANVSRLSDGLREIGINGIREFNSMECPLTYPIRVKNRDNFRRYLMDNRIYCAIHWPFDGFKPEERQNCIYNSETLISLPIDQRYGDKEIDYLIDVISKYGGELLF